MTTFHVWFLPLLELILYVIVPAVCGGWDFLPRLSMDMPPRWTAVHIIFSSVVISNNDPFESRAEIYPTRSRSEIQFSPAGGAESCCIPRVKSVAYVTPPVPVPQERSSPILAHTSTSHSLIIRFGATYLRVTRQQRPLVTFSWFVAGISVHYKWCADTGAYAV